MTDEERRRTMRQALLGLALLALFGALVILVLAKAAKVAGAIMNLPTL